MSSDECRIYISQFHRQAEAKYMQARHDQEHSRIATRVPWYIWVALFALGFNEFRYVLKHPLLFVVFIFFGGMYYLSVKLGIQAFVVNFFKRSIILPYEALRDTIMGYLVRQVEMKKQEEELARKRAIADRENQEEMERLATQARLDQSRNQLTDLVEGMPSRKKPVLLTKRGKSAEPEDEQPLSRSGSDTDSGLRQRRKIVSEDTPEDEEEEKKEEIDRLLNVTANSSDDDGLVIHDS